MQVCVASASVAKYGSTKRRSTQQDQNHKYDDDEPHIQSNFFFFAFLLFSVDSLAQEQRTYNFYTIFVPMCCCLLQQQQRLWKKLHIIIIFNLSLLFSSSVHQPTNKPTVHAVLGARNLARKDLFSKFYTNTLSLHFSYTHLSLFARPSVRMSLSLSLTQRWWFYFIFFGINKILDYSMTFGDSVIISRANDGGYLISWKCSE